MGTVGRWIGQLAGAMVRGCLVLATVALVVAVGLVYGTTRALPSAGEWVLIVVLVITAGCLGAAVTLIWRLSHLDRVAHLVTSRSERPRDEVRVP
jgi:hypothetical protein